MISYQQERKDGTPTSPAHIAMVDQLLCLPLEEM